MRSRGRERRGTRLSSLPNARHAGALRTGQAKNVPGVTLCSQDLGPSTVGADWRQPTGLCHHQHTPRRPLWVERVCVEASPSLVYGAALLMRFGVIPHPGFKSRSLRFDLHDHRSPGPHGRGFFRSRPSRTDRPRAPRARRCGQSRAQRHFRRSGWVRETDFASGCRSCNVVPATPTGKKTAGKPSARSLTDRASDYGSEGCRFESCRAHSR